MDPELFLRGVTKQHRPPFVISPSPKEDKRWHGWHTHMTRWRLLDGDGNVVRRFSKWRYAYCALLGMAARCGVEPASEHELRRLMREERFARLHSKEERRSHHRRADSTRRMFTRPREGLPREGWRERELRQIRRSEEAYRRRFKAKYGYDPPT